MYRYRGYILSFVVCLAVQIATLRFLESVGMRELKIWTIETAALGATVLITMMVGEYFEKRSGGRGD